MSITYFPGNIWTLFFSQPLLLLMMPALIFAGSFIGLELAPHPELATLPVAATLIAQALFTIPVSRAYKAYGRRNIGIAISLFGCGCSLLAWFAISQGWFWFFIATCAGIGVTVAGAQQMRYAALESVAPEQGASALAKIMLGGIVASFLGPEIALRSKDLLAGNYAVMFLFLAGAQITAALLFCYFFREPQVPKSETGGSTSRSKWQIATQPVLIAALLSSITGFGVMALIMVATPMSMHHMNDHSLEASKWVIQSHLLAMFLPSLIAPWLISKIAIRGLLFSGMLAYAICFIAAVLGTSFLNYWTALVLLGVGWNFLFTGSTALLPQSYRSNERHMVQSWNDLGTFSIQALTSIFSAWLLFNTGWISLMQISAIVLLLNFVAVVYWLRSPK